MNCRAQRWIVLLLHIAAVVGTAEAAAQAQYTADGVPTGLEEEIRWRVNRGRFDTASENQTRGTAYTDVSATTGPLAPSQSIALAARHHSEDMAKNNTFQHATIPGSAYYNSATQPNPWDRMRAEGYVWNSAGENIAAGYSGAESVYVGWWNSTGHRQNMYKTYLREIGNGYFYWSASTYRGYYTMDLGSAGNNYFFTDTLFRDANTNGIYEQAEAVSGIAINLLIGSTPHSSYDVSTAAGSFAIPIQSIATGATVQVALSNTTTAPLTLSIPRDYRTCTWITLAARESRVCGTFTQPATLSNFGLRGLTPLAPLVAPNLALTRSGQDMRLLWPSETGLQYRVQWTTNLQVWNNLTASPTNGTGSNLTYLDTGATIANRKFYRLLVTKP